MHKKHIFFLLLLCLPVITIHANSDDEFVVLDKDGNEIPRQQQQTTAELVQLDNNSSPAPEEKNFLQSCKDDTNELIHEAQQLAQTASTAVQQWWHKLTETNNS